MPIIRTVRATSRCEIPKIRGSRFAAALGPAASHADAQAFVRAQRDEAPDATHVCSAWRLASGDARANDDGEPNGTAGRPILQEIEGRDLCDMVVTVTRWYGGTKLGTGGLVRAYGAAAAAGLDAADVVAVPITVALSLRFGYGDSGAVQGALVAADATVVDSRYEVDVALTVAVPIEHDEALRRALRDATAGRIVLSKVG
ncbi:MAG: YigZ family protein [Acidobacteriota bacterium]